jgi:hypothetical protein
MANQTMAPDCTLTKALTAADTLTFAGFSGRSSDALALIYHFNLSSDPEGRSKIVSTSIDGDENAERGQSRSYLVTCAPWKSDRYLSEGGMKLDHLTYETDLLRCLLLDGREGKGKCGFSFFCQRL